MAKTQSLDGNDLKPAKPQNQSATPQRGEEPKAPTTKVASADLVPMQFKMPPEFVKAFKIQAATQGMKLNELLKESFNAFMKDRKSNL
jgi:predicted HicB family RNase H-like nuclease